MPPVDGTAPPTPVTIVAVHGFRGDHHGLEPVVAHLPGRAGRSRPTCRASASRRRSTARARHRRLRGVARARSSTRSASATTPSCSATRSARSSSSAAVADGLRASRLVLVNPIAAPALSGPRGILTRLAVFYYWAGARAARAPRAQALLRAAARHAHHERGDGQDPRRGRSAAGSTTSTTRTSRASATGASCSTRSAPRSRRRQQYAAASPCRRCSIAADRDDITRARRPARSCSALFADARLVVIDGRRAPHPLREARARRPRDRAFLRGDRAP